MRLPRRTPVRGAAVLAFGRLTIGGSGGATAGGNWEFLVDADGGVALQNRRLVAGASAGNGCAQGVAGPAWATAI
jgi:hypothetical protein